MRKRYKILDRETLKIMTTMCALIFLFLFATKLTNVSIFTKLTLRFFGK